MMPSGFKHGKFKFKIANVLEEKLKEKGYIAVGEVGILITKNPFRLSAADIIYTSKATCPEETSGMLEVAPGLVVEILSEDNSAKEINLDFLSNPLKSFTVKG